MSSLASTTVDLARLQFALTSIYHFLFVPLTLGLAHSGTRGDGHESRPHRSPTARDGGGGWWAPVQRSIW